MPTENRSSNTENAPCPFCGGQVDPEGWLRGDGMRGPECDSCGATAPNLALWNGAQPAQHHQGEPVALPARKSQPTELSDVFVDANNEGWNACLGEIAKLGPPYTHPAPADAGEVEQLRERVDLLEKYETDCLSLVRDAESERDTLRAQLAERDALLRDALSELENGPLTFNRAELRNRLHVVLSASAEPSAPAPMPAYMEAACDKFDWTPEEALRFYAEGKHFDTDNGRTRILCTGSIASHALKGMSKEYADLKGSEQREPSAPVEHDHDALVAAVCVLRSHGLANLSEAVEAARAALESKP